MPRSLLRLRHPHRIRYSLTPPLGPQRNTTTSKEDYIPIFKEYNEYIMRQHFQVYGHKAPGFQVAHPWVKGWNGELQLSSSDSLLYLTRIWLDQDLKREMGY